MSTQAQYADKPRLWKTTVSAANPNRDGSGTLSVLGTASPFADKGTRVDKVQVQARADTTVGAVRLFLVRGAPGALISSISFSGTTATVVTTTNHGVDAGDLITVQGAMPDVYNVTNAAATVISTTSFSYPLTSTPTVNAVQVGGYSVISATETPTLWREVPVSAVTVTPRTITSISFSSTTATLTTATAHGLATGDVVVIAGATPAAYNGTFAVTVTGPTTFTYTMASVPATNASVVGTYSVPKAAFSAAMSSQLGPDVGYFPLMLPAGWQVRASTNNAEAFNVTASFVGEL